MSQLVSVVIPAFKSVDVIAGAVESALDQTVPPHEIIVVDDASPDRAELERILAPWIEQSKVVLLHMEENRGPAAARNLGIRSCRGDLIAFLDADDRYERERIEAALDVFHRHPDTAMTGSDSYVVRDGTVLPWLKNDRWRPVPPVLTFEAMLRANYVSAVSVTLRRDVFDELGPFDEDPALVSVEDYDLWLKVARAYTVRYIDRPLCRYCLTPDSLSARPGRMYAAVEAILTRLEKEIPDFKKRYGSVVQKRRNTMRFDLAYELFLSGNRAGARREAWKAIREFPLSLRSYRLLLRAALGLR